jgi:hypothetical protein
MTVSLQEIRDLVSNQKRKKEISGVQALIFVAILDHIEELETRGRSAIKPNFFGDEPSPAVAVDPAKPTTECPVCLTRREWAIGAKV